MTNSNLKFSAKYFFAHLCLSMVAALFVAGAVFFELYPSPFSAILGVKPIFLLLIGVDVIIGPVITAFLANPKKKNEERKFDFLFVGVIQILALMYGMHSIWSARPVALVFEKDRFVLVRANEIYQESGVKSALPYKIPVFGILTVSTTDARTNAELMEGINLASQGVQIAMRLSRWQSFSASDAKVKSAAKKIEILDNSESTKHLMREARLTKRLPSDAKYYIPLTTSQSFDWIVLLDEKYQMRGYLNVEGF